MSRGLLPPPADRLSPPNSRHHPHASRSNDASRRLGAVLAINELIDVKSVADDTSKTARLALLLSKAIEEADDPQLMEVTAATLGTLVKAGGVMTADIVEREVRGGEKGG